MPSSAQQHTRALESAFWDLVRVYRDGGWVDGRGRQLVCHGAPPERVQRLRANEAAAREILTGSRKAWAQDMDEAVLDLALRDDAVTRVVGLRLHQRRTVLNCFEVDMTRGDGADALARALDGVTGLVVRNLTFGARAALGEALARVELAPNCRVVELALPQEADYQNFLAGSFWLDMSLNLGRNDLHAHALLRALQVRSIRRTAQTENRLSYYTVSAIKKLHREGVSAESIAARTGAGLARVCDLTGQPLPTGADQTDATNAAAALPATDAPRAATDRQRAKADQMRRKLPALGLLFAEGWDRDRGQASHAIAVAHAVLQDLGSELDLLGREREARSLLGAGRGLEEAARVARLDPDDLRARLDRDVSAPMRQLAGEVGRRIGAEVRLNQLFPAAG
jgi:hypothetical protein